jgi:S-DNA-T family DNA segregation ATPase FtsK/SpoIIIE
VPADTPDELTAILGVGFTGRPVTINTPDLPHLLMAGTTGSGKSTCLHAIITSILARVQPEQAQMILIDTRSLELARYDRVAHLVTRVATTGEKAAQALTWATREAQARLDTFADAGKRNIEDFNTAVRAGHIRAPLSEGWKPRLYPRLVIAIDDLADLLRSPRSREVQDALFQIGTRGRITGVHVIAGTRHPQAFALPPRVAATMPARLSFAATESAGPTRDLTVGTAELRVPGSNPVRVWCPDVTEREIDAVAGHWRRAAEAALRRFAQP